MDGPGRRRGSRPGWHTQVSSANPQPSAHLALKQDECQNAALFIILGWAYAAIVSAFSPSHVRSTRLVYRLVQGTLVALTLLITVVPRLFGTITSIPFAELLAWAVTIRILLVGGRSRSAWGLAVALLFLPVTAFALELGFSSGRPSGAWTGFVMLWFGACLATWIIMSTRSRSLARAATKDLIEQTRARDLALDQQRVREANRQNEASAVGHLTGLEPSALRSVPLTVSSLMLGRVTTAAQDQLARAMSAQGLLDTRTTFWSVLLPTSETPLVADCVLVGGDAVTVVHLLADETQGNVEWRVEDGKLVCIDLLTHHDVGQPRSMGTMPRRSYEAVAARLRDVGSRRPVRERLVIMPTERGTGITAPGLTLDGIVGIVTLPELLAELHAGIPFQPTAKDAEFIVRALRQYVQEDAFSVGSATAAILQQAVPPRPMPNPAGVVQRFDPAADNLATCQWCLTPLEPGRVTCPICNATQD